MLVCSLSMRSKTHTHSRTHARAHTHTHTHTREREREGRRKEREWFLRSRDSLSEAGFPTRASLVYSNILIQTAGHKMTAITVCYRHFKMSILTSRTRTGNCSMSSLIIHFRSIGHVGSCAGSFLGIRWATAVAAAVHEWSSSLKCRWQVTAKHAYAYTLSVCEHNNKGIHTAQSLVLRD